MSDAIPDHVLSFLKNSIQSISQLELLLLLYRNPETAWSVSEAAKSQYTPESMTQAGLEVLSAMGLVGVSNDAEPRYRYAPGSPELHQVITELERLYTIRRVSIVNAIYSGPLQTLQDFADAFRIRKKENE